MKSNRIFKCTPQPKKSKILITAKQNPWFQSTKINQTQSETNRSMCNDKIHIAKSFRRKIGSIKSITHRVLKLGVRSQQRIRNGGRITEEANVLMLKNYVFVCRGDLSSTIWAGLHFEKFPLILESQVHWIGFLVLSHFFFLISFSYGGACLMCT